MLNEVSPHAYGQLKVRGIAESSVVDALTLPLKVGIIRADKSQQFIGEKATVAINTETGKIITMWPTHTKTVNKLKGGNKK